MFHLNVPPPAVGDAVGNVGPQREVVPFIGVGIVASSPVRRVIPMGGDDPAEGGKRGNQFISVFQGRIFTERHVLHRDTHARARL